jgi:hypothetical protein
MRDGSWFLGSRHVKQRDMFWNTGRRASNGGQERILWPALLRERLEPVATVRGIAGILHALAEIRDDFHRILYAASAETARVAYAAFERTWANIRRNPKMALMIEAGDGVCRTA